MSKEHVSLKTTDNVGSRGSDTCFIAFSRKQLNLQGVLRLTPTESSVS